MDVGDLGGFFEFFQSRIFLGEEQVLSDRSIEHVGFLRDHADILTQIGQIDVADIDVVDPDRSALDIIESWQQVDDRGFS